jgi:hypothetical protein
VTPNFEDTAPHRPKLPSSDSGATRVAPATARRFCNPSSERRFGQPSPTSRSPRTTPRLNKNDRDSSAVSRTRTDPATAPIEVNDPPLTTLSFGVREKAKSPPMIFTFTNDASIVSSDAHASIINAPFLTLSRLSNEPAIEINDGSLVTRRDSSFISESTFVSVGNAWSIVNSAPLFWTTTPTPFPTTSLNFGNGGTSMRRLFFR